MIIRTQPRIPVHLTMLGSREPQDMTDEPGLGWGTEQCMVHTHSRVMLPLT